MSQVFAAPGPPTEVYDTNLDSSTHEDVIFWVLNYWLHFLKFFGLVNLYPEQGREGTSSHILCIVV